MINIMQQYNCQLQWVILVQSRCTNIINVLIITKMTITINNLLIIKTYFVVDIQMLDQNK